MHRKIHQQDRVAHNNTCQCDPAYHGIGRKLRSQDSVHRNNSQQGQWNWRHNQCRDPKITEFPHHQDVDQDQCSPERGAHIPEGFVGHGPLTGPFDTRKSVVRGRPQPIGFLRRCTPSGAGIPSAAFLPLASCRIQAPPAVHPRPPPRIQRAASPCENDVLLGHAFEMAELAQGHAGTPLPRLHQ